MKEMLKKLELEPEQEEQILSILEQSRERFRALDKEAKEARSELRRQIREEIHAVLTEDQARKFDEFMHEFYSRKRGRGMKSEKPPEPPPASTENN